MACCSLHQRSLRDNNMISRPIRHHYRPWARNYLPTQTTWAITPLHFMAKSELVLKISFVNFKTAFIGEMKKSWRHDLMNTCVQFNATKNGPEFWCIWWKWIISLNSKTSLLLLMSKGVRLLMKPDCRKTILSLITLIYIRPIKFWLFVLCIDF